MASPPHPDPPAIPSDDPWDDPLPVQPAWEGAEGQQAWGGEEATEEEEEEMTGVNPPAMASSLAAFFTSLLTCLVAGGVPDLELASLRTGNTAAGGADGAPTRLGRATTTLSLTGRGARGAGRYARLLMAGAAAHEALSTGRCLTQRDLYYSFKCVGVGGVTPASAATAVTDLQAYFRAPRAAFGVVAAARGSVGGQVWLGMAGAEEGDPAWADASAEPAGRPLPGDPAALARLATRTDAAFLLIIEKDAVFRRLCEDRVWEGLPGGAVLVTSNGWPAAGVRNFITRLRAANPAALDTVLGVCDWNPAGVGILCAYKYGTRRAALGCGAEGDEEGGGAEGAGVDAHALPSLGWVGLRSLRLAAAPPEAFQALTPRDRAMAASLGGRALAGHPAWTAELEVMTGSGLKAELEAVDAVGGLGSLTAALVEDAVAGAWAA